MRSPTLGSEVLILGASSWQPLGLNGREFRDTTPRRHSEGIAS